MIKSKIQKITLAVISVLSIVAIAFGFYNKSTFNYLARDTSYFDNAVLDDYSYTADEDNEYCENIDFAFINDYLKEADTIFVGTVNEMSNQYECLKYDVTVDKVVKGDSISDNEQIVFYEYSHFIINNDKELQYFKMVNNNFPLIKNKQYLIFANRMQYEPDYEKKLAKKEFKISDADISTFCLDEIEVKAASPNDKKFKDIKENEYSCFSATGAKNLTNIKKDVIAHYL